MIPLAVLMLRARPWRAAMVAVLAALAVGSAVAVPAYLAAADAASVRAELAAATPANQVVSAQPPAGHAASDGSPSYRPDGTFEQSGAVTYQLQGFQPIFTASFDVGVVDRAELWRLTFRDRVCEHVTPVTGRCPTGAGEVMVGEPSARAGKITVGNTLPMSQLKQTSDGPVPVGNVVPVSVVGVYRPTAPSEPYWGPVSPFPAVGPRDPQWEPVISSRTTMLLFRLEVPEFQQMDLVPRPGTLTPRRLAALPHEIADLTALATAADIHVSSGVPELSGRVAANRTLLGLLVPMAAVPVILLCWYVVFLAVGYASEERRAELGLVALRGSGRGQRWWLAAAESVLALLVGAPVGYLAGHWVAWLGIRLTSGPSDVPVTAADAWWALAALAGALAAALLALRRDLATPTTELLRRVPSRAAWWRTAGAEVVVLGVAAAAVVDQRTSGGRAHGLLPVLVPAVLMLAGGLLVARLLGPMATRAGRRALARGRLAVGLAAIDLARRPASRRVLALLVVGTALMTFAVTTADVGERARIDRAGVEAGAAHVVQVQAVPPAELLHAVRTVDPRGTFAMAAVSVPVTGTTANFLAVDSPRLAATAVWPDRSGGVPPASVPDRIRPARPESIRVDGADLIVDADVAEGPDGTVDLRATVVSVPLGDSAEVLVGRLRAGRHAYTASVPLCRRGCRLASLTLEQMVDAAGDRDLAVTIREIRQRDPDRVIARAADLADPARWRDPEAATGSPVIAPNGRDGLGLRLPAEHRTVTVKVADAPQPLPLLVSGSGAAGVAQGLDGSELAAAPVATVPLLPRLGANGMLADLEYLLASTPTSNTLRSEVWLGYGAPADAVDRLQEQGLIVEGEQRLADALDAQRREGPALATQFSLIAGLLAVLLAICGLALVVGVDRQRRAADLTALRTQGVPARVVRAAATRGQLWLAGAALVAGPALALAVWAVVGDGVPLFADDAWHVRAPVPTPGPLVGPWLGVAVLLLAAAAIAGYAIRGATRPADEGGIR
jgi:putative ABC transport system permease protein